MSIEFIFRIIGMVVLGNRRRILGICDLQLQSRGRTPHHTGLWAGRRTGGFDPHSILYHTARARNAFHAWSYGG